MQSSAALADKSTQSQPLVKKEGALPLLLLSGLALGVRAGTTLAIASGTLDYQADTPIELPEMVPGDDYTCLFGADGVIRVLPFADREADNPAFAAGFHFAPGGNASARSGGDSVPAINPFSFHDLTFRPSCDDPRSMTAVRVNSRVVWFDIYPVNTDHIENGTSRFGATIADGDNRPQLLTGKGRYSNLNFQTSAEILAHHGKRHMTPEEAFEAFYGVTEKTAAPRRSETAGLDAPRTSRYGVMMATGQRWWWGNDGDLDVPRASLFGGSWLSVGNAGSRYAFLDYWPGYSVQNVGARGVCDHLKPE